MSETMTDVSKFSSYDTQSIMDASFLESEMEKINSLSEQPEETLKYTNQLLRDIDKQIEVSFEIMGERQCIIRQYIEKQQENEQWRQDRFNRLMKGFTAKLNAAHDMLTIEHSISSSYNDFSTQTDTYELIRQDRFISSNSQQITDIEPGYGTDEDIPNSIFQDNEAISQVIDVATSDQSRCSDVSNPSDCGFDETGSTISRMDIDTQKYYHIFHDNEVGIQTESQADAPEQCSGNDCNVSEMECTPNSVKSDECASKSSDQGASKKWQSIILQLQWLCKSIDTLLDCFNSAVEELQGYLEIDTSSGDFLKECMTRIRQYEINDNIEKDIVKFTEKQNESIECVGAAVDKLRVGRLDLNQLGEKLQELHAFQFTVFTDAQDHWLQQQVVRVVNVIKTIMKEQKFVVMLIKDHKPENVDDGTVPEESKTMPSDIAVTEPVDTTLSKTHGNMSLENNVIEEDPNDETQNNVCGKKVSTASSESDCGKQFLEEGHKNILAIFNEIKSRMKKMENRLVDTGTCRREMIETSSSDEIDADKKVVKVSRKQEIEYVMDDVMTQSETLTSVLVNTRKPQKDNIESSNDYTKNKSDNEAQEQNLITYDMDEGNKGVNNNTYVYCDVGGQPNNLSEESEGKLLEIDNTFVKSIKVPLLTPYYPLQNSCEDNNFLKPSLTQRHDINMQEAYKLFKTLGESQEYKNVSIPLQKVLSGELPKGTYVKQVMGQFITERCQIKTILTSINENVGMLNNMIFNEGDSTDSKVTDSKKGLLINKIMEMTNMANDISSQFEEKNKALSSFFLFDAYNKKYKRKVTPDKGIPNKFTKLVMRKRHELLNKLFPVQDINTLSKRYGNKNSKKNIQFHNLNILLKTTKDNKSSSDANGNSLTRSKRMKSIVKEARTLRTRENMKKFQYLWESAESQMVVIKRSLNGTHMFLTENSEQNQCCEINSNKKNSGKIGVEHSKSFVFNLSSTRGRYLESKYLHSNLPTNGNKEKKLEYNNVIVQPDMEMINENKDTKLTSRYLGDEVGQFGHMSMDELLNNTIVFEEEYESNLIAISKQLDNIEGDMLGLQSAEVEVMDDTTVQQDQDVGMWTDDLQEVMDKVTKLNDAAVFYTKLTILFENGEQNLGGAASVDEMSNKSTLMGHFQKITETITDLLKNGHTYSRAAGMYLRQVMSSVEEKINIVGAISDALIKHSIAKLKVVLGSTLLTPVDDNISQNEITNGDFKISTKQLLCSVNEPCAIVKAHLISDRSNDVDEEEETREKGMLKDGYDNNKGTLIDEYDNNKGKTIKGGESDIGNNITEERVDSIKKGILSNEYDNNTAEMSKNGEVHGNFDNECLNEEVYLLKDSNEDINDTLRNVIDSYSNSTDEAKITDYLKIANDTFATGINANSEFKQFDDINKPLNDIKIQGNASIDNIESLQHEIKKAERLNIENKSKQEQMIEEVDNVESFKGYTNITDFSSQYTTQWKQSEGEDTKQQSFSEKELERNERDNVYKSNDKDKDRLLKTVKKLKGQKKEIVDGNITTLKNVLQKIVSLEGKKADLQKENIVLMKKLRDLDESFEHEIEDSRRSMTETFSKNIDRLMEKISILTNELIDSEDEKLKVINEANNFKIDAETAYHEMQQQCKVVKEREQSHKVIVGTLEAQLKRLSLENGDLLQEMQVLKEVQEGSIEIRNLQSYEEELKEERLKLDKGLKKIDIEKRKLEDVKSSHTRDDDITRNGEECGDKISFSIYKATQEERDKLSTKLIEVNGNCTETKLELRKLKLQMREQEEQHFVEKDELITNIEKEFKQKVDAIQSRHFTETEQLVMSFNEENQKWEEEMGKLKKDLQEENQKQLAEQKADHDFTLKKLLHDQATLSTSELDEVRQKYESITVYKQDILQQFENEKFVIIKEHEKEVFKLQNTIRKLWSNLKGRKNQRSPSNNNHNHNSNDNNSPSNNNHNHNSNDNNRSFDGQPENVGVHVQRDSGDGAEQVGGKVHQQPYKVCEVDKKLWDEIVEDAVSSSPTKIKQLLTLMKPEKERDVIKEVRNSNKEDAKSNDCIGGEQEDKTPSTRKHTREQSKKKLREEYENLVSILVDLNDEIDKQSLPPKRANY